MSIDSTQETISFSLRGRDLDPAVTYHVTALLDADGDAAPSSGDYATTQDYPIDPDDPPQDLEIVLYPVRT